MKRKSAVILLLLIGFLGLRQEKAYSFAECPSMAFSAPLPMPCCAAGVCHCAAQKETRSNPSDFLNSPGDPGKDTAFLKNGISRIHDHLAVRHELSKDAPKKPSSSQDKLYELYSDYRI